MEFLFAVLSCRGETQCVGNVHNVSSTRVAEFDLLSSLSLSHCVLNVTSRCKFCKNGFFNIFFPLSHAFCFETRPSPLSKSEKMHLARTFCSSTAKTSAVTPIFYFMILIRTVLPFDEKKIGTNLCSVFWQFY